MQTADMAKEQTFKLRLDADDRARADALAEHYALGIAAMMRMLIKRDFDALGLETAKKRSRGGR